MSAWLVFAMLGFYPVQPFSGEYVLGRPMVEATLRLEGGAVMRLGGRGGRAQLNGRLLGQGRVSHADLLTGGELRWGQGRT
jgi:putative alpha-1,2-mannosidase